VGSTEADWGRTDAAEVWADVLMEDLFGGGNAVEATAAANREVCVIGVGGGHYAPALADVVGQLANARLGHIVPTYALDFDADDPALGGLLGGSWRGAITEAVRSTGEAYASWPNPPLFVALVDKKAFKSAQRTAIVELLRELGVEVALSKADVAALAKSASSHISITRGSS
jgi:D-tyrosyl-tRNA(Tyr) deacylase